MNLRFAPRSGRRESILIFEFKDKDDFIYTCSALYQIACQNSKIEDEEETSTVTIAYQELIHLLISRCDDRYGTKTYQYSAMLFQDEFEQFFDIILKTTIISGLDAIREVYKSSIEEFITITEEENNMLTEWLVNNLKRSSSFNSFQIIKSIIEERLKIYNVKLDCDFEFGSYLNKPNKKGTFAIGNMHFVYENDNDNSSSIFGPFEKMDIIYAIATKLNIAKYFPDFEYSEKSADNLLHNGYKSIRDIYNDLHSKTVSEKKELIQIILDEIEKEAINDDRKNILDQIKGELLVIKDKIEDETFVINESIITKIDNLSFDYEDILDPKGYKDNVLLKSIYLLTTLFRDREMKDVFGEVLTLDN